MECVTVPRRSRFTLDVDICLSGGGDPLLIVSLAAELSVLVHTCKRQSSTFTAVVVFKKTPLKVKSVLNIWTMCSYLSVLEHVDHTFR